MADWLIGSDVVHEVAFRIDIPGPSRGLWIVSYLPPDRRLTEAHAVVCIELAETILLAMARPLDSLAIELAQLQATELDSTLEELMWLLATRACGAIPENHLPTPRDLGYHLHDFSREDLGPGRTHAE